MVTAAFIQWNISTTIRQKLNVASTIHYAEVPTAAVCQMVSCDDAIAAKWTKLARLLGLSRSQIDRIRLEYHDRPQPCRQSATEVLSLWRTSGGTANTCSLATLLKVLLHMGQDLVVSKVVECLQSRTDT